MSSDHARLLVLISGSGTNLQAILDACGDGSLPARVVGVISNKADAFGMERALRVGVPVEVLSKTKEQDRWSYDAQLAAAAEKYNADWIVLAGWMRVLSTAFLGHFPGRVVNLHPALPGTFPGTHAIERAYEAFQGGQIVQTGVMVHLVPDEGVDCGPVLAQQAVELRAGETLESLETRIHQLEHVLLVETLRRLITDPDPVHRME
jgi:formyltetrahydrofolate-dependent phosphoribosylglycinamide formyltransferase